MLIERLAKWDVPVWLVNTGWTGGPYGTGERMNINHTRTMVRAALNGELSFSDGRYTGFGFGDFLLGLASAQRLTLFHEPDLYANGWQFYAQDSWRARDDLTISMGIRYEATGEVWVWVGQAAWHFLTLPPDVSEGVRAIRGKGRGWGSVRVEATLGGTTWRTSIFPDRKSGAFLLPLKADVRAREGVGGGDTVSVTVEVLL